MVDNARFNTLLLLCHVADYPASSWFLLRQTREKPLRATVCFSTEHARVRHAPRDTFDANFICQVIFRLKCLYKRMQIARQKRWQKNDPYLEVLYISSLWSTYKGRRTLADILSADKKSSLVG